MRPVFAAHRTEMLRTAAFLTAICAALPVTAIAQAALPPTPPTGAQTSQQASPSFATTAPVVTPAAQHQAQVSYQMGQLTVIAENSSLSAILREIAARTGMKITGSMPDQQVYGTYGPASPAHVIGQLLEGSGANMVLRENATGPVELVLSPMEGMPNSFAPVAPAYSPPPAQAYTPPAYQPAQTYSPARPAYPPQAQPQPVYTQPAPMPPAANAPAPDQATQPQPSVPQSPNGVPTPQQIYEELQRLQQQKAQPASH